MADSKISAMVAANTPLTGAETIPGVQGGLNVKLTVDNIVSRGAVSQASTAWCEMTGNDSTGAVGNPAKPYATINAALDGLSSGGVIHLGIGAFAPITDDYQGSTTPDPASKLKSNITIIGAKRPVPDSYTAPTTLQNGSVIKGALVFNSSRVNVSLISLGVDSGSAVCTALYAGVAQNAIAFSHIAQSGSPTPSTGIKLIDVVGLCQSATASVHAVLVENTRDPELRGIHAFFGFVGLAIKTTGGTVSDVHSFGHSTACVIVKNNTYANCSDVVLNNLIGGDCGAADTTNGLYLQAESTTTDLARITVDNMQWRDVTFDLVTDDGAGNTRQVENCNINGTPVNGATWSLSIANADTLSVSLNGEPLAGPISARVYHNTTQSTTNGVAKVLAFNSERWDPYGMHDTVTNNSRLVAPIDGYYLITGSVEFASVCASGIWITVNGTVVAAGSVNPATTTQHVISTVAYLSAGQYAELNCIQATGTINVLSTAQYSPEFTMTKMGKGGFY